MPTYTYRCNNCEYQFDIKQRMADDPLTDCPECESDNTLRKVLNSVGIVFKGSGFYVTDSRGKNGAAVPSANGKSSEKSSENGDSAKNESTAKENGSKAETSSSANGSSAKAKAEKTAV